MVSTPEDSSRGLFRQFRCVMPTPRVMEWSRHAVRQDHLKPSRHANDNGLDAPPSCLRAAFCSLFAPPLILETSISNPFAYTELLEDILR